MKPKFDLVNDQADDEEAEDQRAPLAVSGLMLALQALSKRFVLALEALFTLFTVGLAWYLWSVIPDPNTNQIVSLGIFAAFLIVINFMVLHRRR